jgi:hypothetical protein
MGNTPPAVRCKRCGEWYTPLLPFSKKHVDQKCKPKK